MPKKKEYDFEIMKMVWLVELYCTNFGLYHVTYSSNNTFFNIFD